MLTIDTLFELDKISTFKYLIVFLTGTFLAIFSVILSPPTSKWLKFIGLIGLGALVAGFILTPFYMGDWMGINNENNGRKPMLLYVFLSGIMLFSALYDKGIFKRILETKLLRFTGIISFSLYLFHMPVIQFINNTPALPDFLKIYFFFGITFLFSIITYLLIERPLSLVVIKRQSASKASSDK